MYLFKLGKNRLSKVQEMFANKCMVAEAELVEAKAAPASNYFLNFT